VAELTLTTSATEPADGPPARGLRAVPAALVSAALLGMNALAYVFTVLAARLLAPHAYGELAALLGVALVGTVPATGLQTAAALALGAARDDVAAVVRRWHATALTGALVVGALGLAAAWPVVALLHLPDPRAMVGLVVLLMAHAVVGGYEGVLQGSGRYGRLVAVTTSFGVIKVAGGIVGLLVGGSPTAALTGMALGAAGAALVGWLGCGRPGTAGGLGATGRAAARAAGALLGFVLLLNLDLLLARHHLSGALAGEYAVAAVVAKITFWLPQGVGVVLLPRLAHAASRRRMVQGAVAVVAGVGGALTLLTAVLGRHTLALVGGSAYGATLGGVTWLFAVLGTLLAAAQLLLYSGIAAADRHAVVGVWAAAVVECVVVESLAATGRLSALALAATAVATAAVLVAAGLLRHRSPGG